MKKIRDFLSRPAVTAVLFLLAAVLLAGSTVTGARAALNIYSENYDAQINLPDIGVALLENEKVVSGKDALLQDLLGEDEELLPGKKYPEILAVRNTADIPEYVRVTVYKYWLDEDGKKSHDLDSDWIELGFVTGDGWVIDADSTTEERTVLYYGPILPVGGESSPFLESITINGDIIYKVTQETTTVGGLTTITTTFDYDGYSFCLEASVDAVQTHNAQDAQNSAWGVADKGSAGAGGN